MKTLLLFFFLVILYSTHAQISDFDAIDFSREDRVAQ